MKIVITGGHFSPAHAVIKKIRRNNEILVIGRKYAFEGDTNETHEYRICQKENIPFKVLNAGRLQRKFSKHTIPAALKFPGGVFIALKLLKEFKPDVVVTFGGYIGLPVTIAAFILHTPVVLHEQTQGAGLSSRLIGKFASVILLSFNSSKTYFGNKTTILTGNPIRPEIFEDGEMLNLATDKNIIYITGGSTGSRLINQTLYEILPELLKDFTVVHQTGNSKESEDFEKFRQFRQKLSSKLQNNYIVKEFFSPENVSWLLKNASLVVSRAGINTIFEMMVCKSPGLLIPLEIGQENEQKENARFFARIGMGTYIEQKDLDPIGLLLRIRAMIKEQKKYKDNAKNADPYIIKNADENIATWVLQYGKRKEGSATTSS